MEELKCPICGEPLHKYYNYRKDKLCTRHGKMADNGEIKLCKNCGKWNRADEVCECKKEENTPIDTIDKISYEKCIICGKESNGKPQCKSCYNETKKHIDSIDKNSNVRKLRDYYYNLKDRIVIIKGLDETKNQCNKLIAIAIVENNINDDTSLIDKVYLDVQTLIKSKQIISTTNEKYLEEKKEKDETNRRINTAQDGHVVDSDMEVRIDDLLYGAYILHCYGKNIDEITEKRKKCDWFIPIINKDGIYIEYWGMENPDYLKDRREKETLYKKYNVPYIGIEKDDPKQDTQTFMFNLLRDITKLAEDTYGFMPKWIKPKK